MQAFYKRYIHGQQGSALLIHFKKLIHLSEMCRITQHVHIQQLCHISTAVSIVFFSEGRSDRRAFFLDHLSLLGLGPSRPDGPDQLPQSDRSGHPLQLKTPFEWSGNISLFQRLQLQRSRSSRMNINHIYFIKKKKRVTLYPFSTN